jgi:hypothetical protein
MPMELNIDWKQIAEQQERRKPEWGRLMGMPLREGLREMRTRKTEFGWMEDDESRYLRVRHAEVVEALLGFVPGA